MTHLSPYDLSYCVSRIPRDLRKLMASPEGKYLFIGGGFIRSCISHEQVNDIDVFGPSKNVLSAVASRLTISRNGKMHETKNAITVVSLGKKTIQFITRWLYFDPKQLCDEFDFTVCKAVIWYNHDEGMWDSVCDRQFYEHLAAKRLVYTFPKRDEDVCGSLLRVRKFLQRGYNIQALSFAGVISRVISGVNTHSKMSDDEQDRAKVIAGLIREVDPLVVVDGVDLMDEHEINAEEESNERDD